MGTPIGGLSLSSDRRVGETTPVDRAKHGSKPAVVGVPAFVVREHPLV